MNIAGEYDSTFIADEMVPNKEELDTILRKATPRSRASVILMAFLGLRLEILVGYNGTGGIKLGDRLGRDSPLLGFDG